MTLAVEDTGIGIDEEQRRRLFQPFAQAELLDHAPLRRHRPRASIVRRLAQLMDGDISAESTPGDGSTFYVRLDLRCGAAGRAVHGDAAFGEPMRRALPWRTGEQPLVLVVDDHPVNQEVLVRQLELLGVAADTAADGNRSARGLDRASPMRPCLPTSTCRAWTAMS